jgi:rhodanese-related sulfurtransferase
MVKTMNEMSIPEISVEELKGMLDSGADFTLLDVRELWELNYASLNLPCTRIIPMSKMAQERQNAFPEDLRNPQAEIVVMCHHGIRSANVTAWLLQLGWKNVRSLAGGIHEYALKIDKSVGMY